jgi:hypothetical protein
MAATLKVLQQDKNADFQTVKKKVARYGELFPIVYGRAKALLGLAKAGNPKPAKRIAATIHANKTRGPAAALQAAHARRERAAGNGALDEGHTTVGRLQALLAERDALNAKIASIEEVLS